MADEDKLGLVRDEKEAVPTSSRLRWNALSTRYKSVAIRASRSGV